MPSLYRHLVLADAQRIAQSFKLSMSLVHRCATYQHIRGPQIFFSGRRPVRSPPHLLLLTCPPDLAAAPTPAPTPAPAPMQVTERPEEELDLIARGIAKAIAAASAPGPRSAAGPPMIQQGIEDPVLFELTQSYVCSESGYAHQRK